MIYIHKGDDTDFNDNSFLTFNIVTEKDLTGWQAKFILNGLEKTFEDITSKSFELHYSDEETSQFKLGKTTNELRLIDEEGKIKTVAKNIEIYITNDVIENESQLINLPILKDEGIDINISLASNSGGGGATNHFELLYRDMENQHPIKAITNLKEILDGKQSIGNYALKSELPTKSSELENDSNYTTQTDVLALIASIPQFKLSIVDTLPETGEKMMLYFVPKEGVENDIYNEYIWIEQTLKFEFLGTTAIDLSDYVTKKELETKQDILVSGTNIKTINNQSIIGDGNITIEGGSGASGSNYNLFDTKITDYILEGEKAEGWALQGTYVSGALYPDFYNKCLEEYQNESNTGTKIKTNIEIVGTPTNNNEVFSGFATSNYIKTTIPMTPNNSTWEVQFEATTGSNVSTKQILFGGSDRSIRSLHIAMDNGKWSMDLGAGSSWIATTITNNIAVIANTKYLLKAIYDGNEYILQGSTDNGSTWVEFAKYTTTTPITNMTETKFGVGRDYASPFLGSINLNKAYFNIADKRIWAGVEFIFKNPNGHKYYPISQLSEIGDVYAYGIDEINETVLLPRSKNIQDYEYKWYRVI